MYRNCFCSGWGVSWHARYNIIYLGVFARENKWHKPLKWVIREKRYLQKRR